jgi:hypothetical protein
MNTMLADELVTIYGDPFNEQSEALVARVLPLGNFVEIISMEMTGSKMGLTSRRDRILCNIPQKEFLDIYAKLINRMHKGNK